MIHEPADDGDDAVRSSDVLRTGYLWKGRVAAARHGQGPGLRRRAPMAPQREWFEKDYYKVLGVSETATARRSPAPTASWPARTTPTPTPATQAAEERFKEISAAYDVVGDADKRKEYDEVRKLGPMGGRVRRWRGPVASRSRPRTCGDLGDLLGGLFNRRPRRSAAASAAPAPARATTSRPSCTCRSTTRCAGVTTRSTSRATRRAPTCHGSGAEPGTTPTTVPRLRRRGVIDDNQGFFSFSRRARPCRGDGS